MAGINLFLLPSLTLILFPSLFSPPFSALIPARRSSFPSPDEFLQHPRVDAALLGFRRLRPPAGRRCRVDGLLAADGGGDRAAAEPDHRGQDGAALRPVEGLLRGRSVAVSIHPSCIHPCIHPSIRACFECILIYFESYISIKSFRSVMVFHVGFHVQNCGFFFLPDAGT